MKSLSAVFAVALVSLAAFALETTVFSATLASAATVVEPGSPSLVDIACPTAQPA